MTVEIVKEILDIEDSDFELPVIARKNDVPLDKVLEFAKYIQEPIEIAENCEYEIGLFAD